MIKSKQVIGLFLTFVVLTTFSYVVFNNGESQFKIKFYDTHTEYYTFEDSSFVLAANEYIKLLEGTKILRASSREQINWSDENNWYFQNIAYYKNNISTYETFTFNINESNIENTPIKHSLKCLNCENLFVQFEIRDILYNGITKTIESPFSFGHNMKIEWKKNDDFSWAKVYQNSYASDKIIVKFKADEPNEEYSVRLYDPSEYWNSSFNKCVDYILRTNATFTNVTDVVVLRINETGMQSDGGDIRVTNNSCDKPNSPLYFKLVDVESGDINLSVKMENMYGSEFNISIYFNSTGDLTNLSNSSIPSRPFSDNWGFELGDYTYWTNQPSGSGGFYVDTGGINYNKIGTYGTSSYEPCAPCDNQGTLYSDSFYLNSLAGSSLWYYSNPTGQTGGLDVGCDGSIDISLVQGVNWGNISTSSYIGKKACWRFKDEHGEYWQAFDYLRIFDAGNASVTENPLYVFSQTLYTEPINLTSPINGYNSSSSFVETNCSFIQDNVLNLSLRINGETNYTIYNTTSNQGQINLSLNQEYSDSYYNWTCLGINDVGSYTQSNYTFLVDNTSSIVNITYPLQQNYSVNITELNYTLIEDNPDTCLWSNNSFAQNYSLTCGENITNMNSTEGYNIWWIWTNDTVGHISSDNVTFFQDTIYPLISIPFPVNNSYFPVNDIVGINLTITETNPASCYWTNDSGVTNNSFNCLQNISGLDWMLGQQNVTVYIEDTLGQINSSSVTFYYENISLQLNNKTTNITAELGTPISLNATNTVRNISIDIIHPSYGVEYTTNWLNSTYNIIINYFRNTLFTVGSIVGLDFTYVNDSTVDLQNFYVPAHQYDEVINLSINVSGITTGDQLIFYHPDNLSSDNIDRAFYGDLLGSEFKINKSFYQSNYLLNQTIAFENAGEKLVYFYLDDNSKVKNFTLSVSGQQYGFDYFNSFENFTDIDTTLTDAQLDPSGAIMLKNSSLEEVAFDEFSNGVVDNFWLKSSDYSTAFSAGTITEENNYTKILQLWTGGGSASGNNNLEMVPLADYLNLYSSETIKLKLENYYSADEDNVGCAGNFRFSLGGTNIWESSFVQTDDDPSSTSEVSSANVSFTLTKYNSTSWRVQIEGDEISVGNVEDSGCDTQTLRLNWTSGKQTINWSGACASSETDLDNDFYATVDYYNYYAINPYAYWSATTSCNSITLDSRIHYVNNSRYSRENSSVTSNVIFNSDVNIPSATLNSSFDTFAGYNNTIGFYLSSDNGANWEPVTVLGNPVIFSNPGTQLKWKALLNTSKPGYQNYTAVLNGVNISIEKGYPENLTFDFGNDDIQDYNLTVKLNTSKIYTIDLSNIDISGFSVFNGTSDVGDHTFLVPLEITSENRGIVYVDNISLNYNPNPIYLNTTSITNTILNFSGTDNINFTVGAVNGSINLTDLRYDFAGGNQTIEVKAHTPSYSLNISRYINYFFSRWDYYWIPNNVEWLFFSPRTPTSQNVTPYGQTSTTPILQVKNFGYGDNNVTLSILQNDTLSCVNTTISLTQNKSDGFLLNESFQALTNLTYLQNTSIYLFADYGCNYSTWRMFEPYYYFKQDCIGCYTSEDLV